ncbi:MAG: hypothetical protein HYW34_00310 [Candidatus Brennerbacteria bacterium]|nr:hypothetical protein [Candidatus Brennerbacteria bacterium]
MVKKLFTIEGMHCGACAAGIEKGSGDVLKKTAGKISREDIRKIAERKMIDLNTDNVEEAEKIIAGTAKSMGIEVMDYF